MKKEVNVDEVRAAFWLKEESENPKELINELHLHFELLKSTFIRRERTKIGNDHLEEQLSFESPITGGVLIKYFCKNVTGVGMDPI